MNKDEQTKALAELGGYTELKGVMEYDGAYMPWTIMERDGNEYNSTDKRFHYLTSHDAIIPVIERMPTENRMKFINVLEDIAYTKDFGNYWDVQFAIITATPQQLAEALLRASGRWQETK